MNNFQYDVRFRDLNKYADEVMLYMSTALTFVIIIILFFQYQAEIDLLKEQLVITRKDTLWTTPKKWNFLIELFLIIPHPNMAT
jgi:hypothetical protein